MKKLLLSLCLLFGSIRGMAYDAQIGGIYYNLSDAGEATVTHNWPYSYKGYNITIPETVNYQGKTYKVVAIGNSAFNDCENLTNISLPNSITCIGSSAFYGCKSLTSISLPNSITSIGDHAFSWCKSLTSFRIPDGVEDWSNNYSIFWECTNLKELDTGEGLKYVGSLFSSSDLSNLTSLYIGRSVTTTGYSNRTGTIDFSGLKNLEKVVVSDQNPNLDSRGDCNAIIGTATNELIRGWNNSKIPKGVEVIGASAFSGCSMTSIEIPNGVKTIASSAFYNCANLTSITIPSSVDSIDVNPFRYCTALEQIVVEPGNAVFDSRDNCNAVIKTQTNTLIATCKNTIIPNSVTSIGISAFRGCTGLTSINIPNGVTSIGNEAFSSCSGLTSINIPNGVTSIGNYAFSNCSGLTSISIPNSVTSIGNEAFSYCSGLTSVTIPNNVTSIGYSTFYGCTSLISVTIPHSVTSIGYQAFSNCSGLTSVTIPNNVTSIGNSTFSNCI